MDDQNFKNMTGTKKLIFTALAVILGLFLLSLTAGSIVDIQNKIIGRADEIKNTITVSGTGEVFVKPDLALIDFSVVTEDKTVASALSKNTVKMNAVISFLKNQGIEDKDLKTTSFSIFPRYEFQREIQIFPPFPEGKRILIGYEVSQSLEVKIRNLGKTGEIIEGATKDGANQVGDLRFTVDKEDDLKSQARAQAIGKAKSQAEEISSQLGIKLVRITNFSESGGFPIFFGAEKISAPAGGAPQIEVGENKISVTVSITYEIR